MTESQAILVFAALAQETRLKIVRALVRAGPDGLSAGSLAEALSVSASNLSFHLKEVERAGLVVRRRKATSIIYSMNFTAMTELVAFLSEDCCAGGPCR